MESSVRPAMFAGSFYPDNPEKLKRMLQGFFNRTHEVDESKSVKALIVPHAGYVFSGQTAAWGWRQIADTNFFKSETHQSRKSQHILLVGPSHNFPVREITGNSFQVWETPLGEVKHIPPQNNIPVDNRIFTPEHSLEVQLPFLQYITGEFSISCLIAGRSEDYKQMARVVMDNYPDSIIVVSSDLSHYLSLQDAKNTDKQTIKAIIDGNTGYLAGRDNIACGYQAVMLLMEMAKLRGWNSRLIYSDTSATYAGDTSRVVGYTAIGYY